MLRTILGALIIAGALVWVLRYDMQPNTTGAFWRLDRWTGLVSLCVAQNPRYQDRAIQLTCLEPEDVPEGFDLAPPVPEDGVGEDHGVDGGTGSGGTQPPE